MDVAWDELFVFNIAPLELFIRGTIVFWFIYILMRTAGRRDFGSIGMANILLIVLIADAAQNAMSADYQSIAEGMLLIGTLVFWSFFIDVLCYFWAPARKVLEPGRICLVKDGIMQARGMRREFITVEELMAELRMQGIDDIGRVHRAYIEQTGKVSIVLQGEEAMHRANRKQ